MENNNNFNNNLLNNQQNNLFSIFSSDVGRLNNFNGPENFPNNNFFPSETINENALNNDNSLCILSNMNHLSKNNEIICNMLNEIQGRQAMLSESDKENYFRVVNQLLDSFIFQLFVKNPFIQLDYLELLNSNTLTNFYKK